MDYQAEKPESNKLQAIFMSKSEMKYFLDN